MDLYFGSEPYLHGRSRGGAHNCITTLKSSENLLVPVSCRLHGFDVVAVSATVLIGIDDESAHHE
jgi:hypothetical protein